jgi:uncharacterized membrane protein
MQEAYAELIGAAGTFVGTHFALSHPLRERVIALAGRMGFRAIYSLVALASFTWMALAFRKIPADAMPLWDGTKPVAWALASAIMLVASILLVGSFFGNPAMPGPNAKRMAKERPHGVFRATRHPMMWSFALWSAAHVLVAPVARVMILSGAIAFLALAGSLLQDGKKKDQLGDAWTRWEERTHFLPRLGKLIHAGPVALVGGLILWVGASWAHLPTIYVPAGIWRWVG